MDWVKRIRKMKKDGRFTNYTLAQELGVHPNTVTGWLYERRIPSPLAREKIKKLERKLKR